MHKRIMQVIILFGVMGIPTFALADNGLVENPGKTKSLVEPVSKEVTETTTRILNETEQTVTNTVGAVNELTENVTETVEVAKPLVEVNLSKEPSIKANTGKVEVNVSKTPLVKVDTNEAKVKVSEPLNVEIDTKLVQTEISFEPPQTNEKPMVKSALEPNSKFKSISEKEILDEKQVIVEPTIGDSLPVVIGNSQKPLTENEFDPLIALPTFQSGPYNKVNSSSGAVNMAMALIEPINYEYASGFFMHFGQGRMFFDQWLNAPPSQPPQKSLFTISRILKNLL